MNKDDALKAMKARVKEGKARKSRQWLDELERSVKAPATEKLWGRQEPKKTNLNPDGTIPWY